MNCKSKKYGKIHLLIVPMFAWRGLCPVGGSAALASHRHQSSRERREGKGIPQKWMFTYSIFWGGLRRLDPLFWEAWLLRMLIGSYRWLDFVDGIYTNWSSNLLGETYKFFAGNGIDSYDGKPERGLPQGKWSSRMDIWSTFDQLSGQIIISTNLDFLDIKGFPFLSYLTEKFQWLSLIPITQTINILIY